MPMEALGDVLGIPPEDRPKFFHWVDQFASPYDTRVTASFEDLLGAIMAILEYAPQLAEIRRQDPGDDVMSKIVQAVDEDRLSEDEIQGNVALLASGAAESTRTTLGHGMHELMRDPEQMAWLRERADDIPATVAQELVRIACPFTHLSRTATKEVELHGQEIREGDKIAMLFAAGNFDNEVFDDPRRLTCPGTRIRTSASGAVRTRASASTSRRSRSRSCSRSCCNARVRSAPPVRSAIRATITLVVCTSSPSR